MTHSCDEPGCGARGRWGSCYICKRNLCFIHRVTDNGPACDSPSIYCQTCWEIGEPYRRQIRFMEDKHEFLVEIQEAAWRDECAKRMEVKA